VRVSQRAFVELAARNRCVEDGPHTLLVGDAAATDAWTPIAPRFDVAGTGTVRPARAV
jgi:hypothetical protein